jgi:PAS domain-containing protein
MVPEVATEDSGATGPAPPPPPPRSRDDEPGRFLSAVLDNLTDALVACDAAGTLTLFNPAAQRLHGLPATAIPAAQWPQYYALFHADGVTPLALHDVPLMRALRGEVVRDVEMVVAPAGQSPRTLLASGQQILDDDDGDVQGAVVVMHDITALRAAEALKATQALLETQRRAAEASLARLEQLNAAALAVNRQHSVDSVLRAIVEQAASAASPAAATGRRRSPPSSWAGSTPRGSTTTRCQTAAASTPWSARPTSRCGSAKDSSKRTRAGAGSASTHRSTRRCAVGSRHL